MAFARTIRPSVSYTVMLSGAASKIASSVPLEAQLVASMWRARSVLSTRAFLTSG